MDRQHYTLTSKYFLQQLRSRADITVPTIEDRDSIKTFRRKWGFVVGVYNDTNPDNNGLYSIMYDKSSTDLSDNDNWERIDDLEHAIDDTDYHKPDPENKEKIVILDKEEGAPTYIDLVGDEKEVINIEKDFSKGEIKIDFDETKVDHNNLHNYETDRHRKMNYNDQLKSYIIND